MTKRYNDEQPSLPDYQDMTLEGYIRKYFIDPSIDHPMKFPKVILERLGFMGSLMPIEFWTWLLEQPYYDESRRMDKKKLIWKYADRIAQCAAIFVNLPEKDQDYILKARRQEQPIWWRGDTMDNFRRIAKETYSYHQLTEEEKIKYRKSCMMQVKRMTSHA